LECGSLAAAFIVGSLVYPELAEGLPTQLGIEYARYGIAINRKKQIGGKPPRTTKREQAPRTPYQLPFFLDLRTPALICGQDLALHTKSVHIPILLYATAVNYFGIFHLFALDFSFICPYI
jgi:hypothetical protein